MRLARRTYKRPFRAPTRTKIGISKRKIWKKSLGTGRAQSLFGFWSVLHKITTEIRMLLSIWVRKIKPAIMMSISFYAARKTQKIFLARRLQGWQKRGSLLESRGKRYSMALSRREGGKKSLKRAGRSQRTRRLALSIWSFPNLPVLFLWELKSSMIQHHVFYHVLRLSLVGLGTGYVRGGQFSFRCVTAILVWGARAPSSLHNPLYLILPILPPAFYSLAPDSLCTLCPPFKAGLLPFLNGNCRALSWALYVAHIHKQVNKEENISVALKLDI